MGVMKLGAVLALALATGVQSDPPEERIYGRVTTVGGEVLEGYIRWDRNEASWSDFLDATKEIPWEHLYEAEQLDPVYAARRKRERSIEAFGVRITWDIDDDEDPVRVASAVRFGHLASLTVLDDRRALLTLKTGEEIVLRSSSTDLGRSLREVIVEDVNGDEVELEWRDLDLVEFMPAPAGAPPPERERLHGTLTTRGGVELTGFVAWDLDEVFTTDVLDGEDEVDRSDREIVMGDIAAIEWESSRSARVVLHDGTELILRGTNDVNRENRGIEISDPSFGRGIVSWEDFDALIFHDRRRAAGAYGAFTGSGPLYGMVRTTDGEEITGRIRWDNDEQFGWEVLDGWSEGVDYDIELGRIRSIERESPSRVSVTLLDGTTLELDGSNDVDRENKGVFVTPQNGSTVLVRWAAFQRLDLEW
jgi:hypothetical protein